MQDISKYSPSIENIAVTDITFEGRSEPTWFNKEQPFPYVQ